MNLGIACDYGLSIAHVPGLKKYGISLQHCMVLTLIFVMKMVVFTTASREEPRPTSVAFRLSIACIDTAVWHPT